MRLSRCSETLQPSCEKARDEISDEVSRMSTGAEIIEKLICVDWLNFEGAGAYIRLDYQVSAIRYTFLILFSIMHTCTKTGYETVSHFKRIIKPLSLTNTCPKIIPQPFE